MPTEEIKELVLDVVVCEEHSENENHSDDFGAYLDDRYEIIGGAVRKGSKSRSGCIFCYINIFIPSFQRTYKQSMLILA
jgi:hypothetical protein